MKCTYVFVMAISVFMLSGCSTGSSLLEEDPRCPFTQQGGCQSIKSIAHMIDASAFTSNGDFVQQPREIYEPYTCRKKVKMTIPSYVDKFGKQFPPKEYFKTVNC